MSGVCYLVGAGPGDLGLMTLRAKELVEKADVLVYDALSSVDILDWTRPECEKIYAGKRADNHAIPQSEINQILVDKALEGLCVVRLKGGDPMIFGRGGEEAAELRAAGVKFELVPGISSTIGGPAYAGIPVTHREHCSQLTIFTGHEDPTKETSSLDYPHLAKTPGTKVFVMGVSHIREICKQLIENGQDPNTPMALTRWATRPYQKTISGTVATIPDIVESTQFKSPAVAVIGDVVKERELLNWFEERPLFGKRIAVTRTRAQAGSLSKKLTELGAQVLEMPTIKTTVPEDKTSMLEGIAGAHKYDWLVFSSPNGVEAFFEGFYKAYSDARSLGGCKIATVGPATARKVKSYRFEVDLIPDKHIAEGLVEAFKAESIENQTILYVKAETTRDVVYEGLTEQGAIIDECVVYRTVPELEDPTGAKAEFSENGADYITFTSGSTATYFNEFGLTLPENCKTVAIGPVTSEVLEKLSYPVDVQATEHNINGLVEAILKDAESSKD